MLIAQILYIELLPEWGNAWAFIGPINLVRAHLELQASLRSA
jgi:hypothetical protein